MPRDKAAAREQCRTHYGSQGVGAVREFCECAIEDYRDQLEKTLRPESCFKIQGKISALRELLEEIKPQPGAGNG